MLALETIWRIFFQRPLQSFRFRSKHPWRIHGAKCTECMDGLLPYMACFSTSNDPTALCNNFTAVLKGVKVSRESVGAFCWHLRRAGSRWRRFEVSWSRFSKAPSLVQSRVTVSPPFIYSISSVSITAAVIAAVWLLMVSTPAAEVLMRKCSVHLQTVCMCVCVCVFVAVPDVCLTRRSVSQLLAPHCHRTSQLTPALHVAFPFSVM